MKNLPTQKAFLARHLGIPKATIDKWQSVRPEAILVRDQDIFIDGPIASSGDAELFEAFGLDLKFATPDKFRAALDDVKGEVTLWINSPGGSVFDAGAMLAAMETYQAEAPINVVVDGMAASAATTLAVHGSDRRIAKTAMFMIHNAWIVAMGDTNDMARNSGILADIDGTYAGIMAEKSDLEEDAIRAAMAEETWYTAQAAVEAGFFDGIYEPERVSKKSRSRATQYHQTLERLHAHQAKRTI